MSRTPATFGRDMNAAKTVAKACYRDGIVALTQQGFDRFTVIYGLQIKAGLTYGEAATELGAALMHQAACNGQLDNRTRAEARKAGDTRPNFDAVPPASAVSTSAAPQGEAGA